MPSMLDRRFRQFDRQNPHVYNTLVGLARTAKAHGRTKLGMKMLYEVARWELSLNTTGDHFRLNNDFTSRYARKIMKKESDLTHLFNTRRVVA